MPNQDAIESQQAQADKLLDTMDSLAPLLIRQADAFFKRNPDIEKSALDWQQFVGAVEDAVSDLLYDQREKLSLEHAKDRRYPLRTSFPKSGKAMNLFDEVVGMVRAYNRTSPGISAPDTLQPEPRYVADVTVKAIDALDAITGDGMVNPYAAARRVVSTGMSCQEIGE